MVLNSTKSQQKQIIETNLLLNLGGSTVTTTGLVLKCVGLVVGGEGGLEVAPLTSLRCLGVFDRLSLSLSSSQVFLNKKAKASLTVHILQSLGIVNSEQCVFI